MPIRAPRYATIVVVMLLCSRTAEAVTRDQIKTLCDGLGSGQDAALTGKLKPFCALADLAWETYPSATIPTIDTVKEGLACVIAANPLNAGGGVFSGANPSAILWGTADFLVQR